MPTSDSADAVDEASPFAQAVDTTRPNIARVYDYWLGGKDNFAADREEAERMLTVYPLLRERARENRLFLARAVTWLAKQGIRQFLDIGSGLPTAQNTHRDRPGSRSGLPGGVRRLRPRRCLARQALLTQGVPWLPSGRPKGTGEHPR